MSLLYISLILILHIIPRIGAILADDAYLVDYHYELLGLPLQETTFFFRPRKDDKATLLYTLSDLNVIGAINPGTGKLVWRQIIDNQDEKGFIRSVDEEDAIITGVGGRVDCWNAMNGIMKWNVEFPGVIRDLQVIKTITNEKTIQKILVLLEEEEKTVLKLLQCDSGDLIWDLRENNSDIPFRINGNSNDIFLVSLLGAKNNFNIRVTTIDLENGKKRNEFMITSKAEISSSDDVFVNTVNSAIPMLAWIDKATKNIIVNILTRAGPVSNKLPIEQTDSINKKVIIHAPNIFESQPHFLVYLESEKSNKAEVYHVDTNSGIAKKAYELPRLKGKSVISIICEDSSIFFIRTTQDEITILSSTSDKQLGKWPVKIGSRGDFIHATTEIVRRSENSYAVRSAVLTEIGAFTMIRNGIEAWVRYEGLSGAVAAEWAEIPGKGNLVATLHAEAHSSVIHAYSHRVKRHFHDLRFLPQYLQDIPKRILGSILSTELATKSEGLIRDKFGFNKIVLLATLRGDIYALESNKKGSIVWSLKAFERSISYKWNVKGMWADSAKGTLYVYGAYGEFLVLDYTTGKIIEKFEPEKPLSVSSTALVENERGRWLLPIGPNGIPDAVPLNQAPSGLLVTRGKDGVVQGVVFVIKNNQTLPCVTWEFQPGFEKKIINVVSRPSHDPVASIGRVLGDRNVLYKYLNPNIILVTAVSDQASTASFYLLDSVSGQILYSTTHYAVDTKQPITSTLTENWFAYSLWSDVNPDSSRPNSSKGYQIVVSELFESKFPNDRGPLGPAEKFSSLEPSDEPNSQPVLPYVISQSFIIPEPINHMKVTQTRQGITSRQLVCTLYRSNAIIGIPYVQLDPRRPVGRPTTSLEAEEGLFQYQPLIDFHPSMIITHEREVAGVKGIITSPTLLESTSLVFAYGIDIFGTRVTPSLPFDILGNSFNKMSLVATILALAIGVLILAPIAKRKQINKIWMTS
ncbi:ER membrane protein complex subunit 1 [Erysiphe necator]|nr:ER membrane protein complex subunit 1 [Erysiphe necator]